MDDRPEHPDLTPPNQPPPEEAETATSEGLLEIDPQLLRSPSLIGQTIGDCTIKRIVGTGGMGTVYEAIQKQPRRLVALKMMKRGITSPSSLRRFNFEIQLLGRLQHPGIAQVYEAGTHNDAADGDSLPYFVMEYIPNAKTITEYALEKQLNIRERLNLIAMVCNAVFWWTHWVSLASSTSV
jgi:hypothetical protein